MVMTCEVGANPDGEQEVEIRRIGKWKKLLRRVYIGKLYRVGFKMSKTQLARLLMYL